MPYHDYFQSSYLCAADLDGQDRLVKIDCVVKEKVGKNAEVRPVLYVAGGKKGVILNKTNFRTIAKAFGQDEAQWKGAQIVLYATPIEFEGEIRDAIRVKLASPAAPPINDSLPF